MSKVGSSSEINVLLSINIYKQQNALGERRRVLHQQILYICALNPLPVACWSHSV